MGVELSAVMVHDTVNQLINTKLANLLYLPVEITEKRSPTDKHRARSALALHHPCASTVGQVAGQTIGVLPRAAHLVGAMSAC